MLKNYYTQFNLHTVKWKDNVIQPMMIFCFACVLLVLSAHSTKEQDETFPTERSRTSKELVKKSQPTYTIKYIADLKDKLVVKESIDDYKMTSNHRSMISAYSRDARVTVLSQPIK